MCTTCHNVTKEKQCTGCIIRTRRNADLFKMARAHINQRVEITSLIIRTLNNYDTYTNRIDQWDANNTVTWDTIMSIAPTMLHHN